MYIYIHGYRYLSQSLRRYFRYDEVICSLQFDTETRLIIILSDLSNIDKSQSTTIYPDDIAADAIL